MTPTQPDIRGCECVRAASVPSSTVDVTVIIPSFNTSRFVLAAIFSALQQTYRAIEVVVVDDGSTDDSVEQILSVRDERLTCVRQPNGGLAAARNTGIRLARGRYIAFLDSDDLWSPAKLAHHVAAMEQDPSVGVTFCHSAYLTENGEPTGEYLVSRCQRPDRWQLIKRNHIGNGSTPVVRRECFQNAGIFDEELRACEDWEFWVRVAALSGFTFKLIPEVLTGYRVRPGSLSVTSGSYVAFLANGFRAIERFGRSVPEFSSAHAAGARAQLYRVTSRKALSNGDVASSREFLIEAIAHSPAAILSDVRAWALIAFHAAAWLLPRRIQQQLFRISRAVLIYGVWRSVVPRQDFATPGTLKRLV